jgi:OOP family OmpA-OmpF porin
VYCPDLQSIYSKFVNKFSFLLILLTLAGWSAQANEPKTKDSSAQKTELALIQPFGSRFVKADPAPAPQARVLIYRVAQAAKLEPVNIYLNGRFHTSLLLGGYSEFCAQPHEVLTHAVLGDARKMHTGRLEPGQKWQFQSGQTLFLKVLESGRLQETPAEQALKEISGTSLQAHLITRSDVPKDCLSPEPVQLARPVVSSVPIQVPENKTPQVKPVEIKPPVPRLYALESDAMFDFGKSELRATSYNTIELMAQRLKRDYSSVERIRVVGHSDPIGQVKSNQKLSLERAKVVAQQLKERGINPVKGFQVEGEGSRHLVKVSCGNAGTPQNKLCHAPNRRVEIIVTGAKR